MLSQAQGSTCGVDPAMLCKIMGHANPTITINLYCHPGLEDMKNAIRDVDSTWLKATDKKVKTDVFVQEPKRYSGTNDYSDDNKRSRLNGSAAGASIVPPSDHSLQLYSSVINKHRIKIAP